MFETAELGRKLGKREFEAAENQLRSDLLMTQREIREAGLPVVLIVSGVEGSGKGAVVNRLTAWLDARGMSVHVFWEESDDAKQRPEFWRFWRKLPPRGTVGVMFGSWYTRPIVDRAFERSDDAQFHEELHRIVAFEQMLSLDGAIIVKAWFHLSKAAQKKQYRSEKNDGRAAHWSVSPLTKDYAARYDNFVRVSEVALRRTDTGLAPWHVIEATNARYRDITIGQVLLAAMKAGLARGSATTMGLPPVPPVAASQPNVLDMVPLSKSLSGGDYKEQLAHYQRKLSELSWAAYHAGVSTVAVFEGWDAGGKGGAIRRATAAIDARLCRVIPVAAPTEEERAQHYLWRFWRQVPRAGRVTIYDRSWYGRVLVERVENFAQPAEWSRAYHEINEFEEQLVEANTVVAKFWLHIDPEEQLRRFEARKNIPWKAHKITDEDWRNRDRWDDYALAVHDMVQHTSSSGAPWHLVPANDKRYARVFVLKTLCKMLSDRLGRKS
jgi:AMP-polyphosphate phosphotransferase